MRTELRIDLSTDHFNKELETIKTQSKIGNSVSEIKSNLKAMNSRLNDTERLSDLEDRIMQIT